MFLCTIHSKCYVAELVKVPVIAAIIYESCQGKLCHILLYSTVIKMLAKMSLCDHRRTFVKLVTGSSPLAGSRRAGGGGGVGPSKRNTIRRRRHLSCYCLQCPLRRRLGNDPKMTRPGPRRSQGDQTGSVETTVNC